MAIICPKYNLLFIQVPRTGSTSVEVVLSDKLEGRKLFPSKEANEKFGIEEIARKHMTLNDLVKYEILDEEELSRYFKVCCVRNPYDRCLSLYSKMKFHDIHLVNDEKSRVYERQGYKIAIMDTQDKSFNQWIFRRYGPSAMLRVLGLRRNQRSYYRKFTKGMDFVMRFENLEEDFKEMLNSVGADPGIVLPKLNQSSRKVDYLAEYSILSKWIYRHVFHDDFKDHGYL